MQQAEGHGKEQGWRQCPAEGACAGGAEFLRGALLLQEKWVLVIVHGLLGGPLSFCDLLRRGAVNTATLTQRLHLLEEAGLLTRTVHSAMPPRTSYALTEGGLALRPILKSIEAWSRAYLSDHGQDHGCPDHKCPASQTTNAS